MSRSAAEDRHCLLLNCAVRPASILLRRGPLDMEPKWHEHEIGYSQEHRDIQSRYWPAPMMDKYAKERVCLVPSQQFRGNSPSRFIDGKEALEKDDVLSFKI